MKREKILQRVIETYDLTIEEMAYLLQMLSIILKAPDPAKLFEAIVTYANEMKVNGRYPQGSENI